MIQRAFLTILICAGTIGGIGYFLYVNGHLTSRQPAPQKHSDTPPPAKQEVITQAEIAELTAADVPAAKPSSADVATHVEADEPIATTPKPIERVPLAPEVTHFVDQYCTNCHNPEKEKGDRNLLPFVADANAPDHHLLAEEILDQLNLGEMPPDKKNVAQPDEATRLAVIEELTRYLNAVKQNEVPEASVLRRLTRYEYKYTIRDLLGVDPDASDATIGFPIDNNIEGFYNVGAAQALSDQQMQQYMSAARHYLDQALYFGEDQPRVETYTFEPADFNGRKNLTTGVFWRTLDKREKHLDIGFGTPNEEQPTYPRKFMDGVRERGTYRISVKAAAMDRLTTPYDQKYIRHDLSGPIKMGLWHVPDRKFLSNAASQGRIFLKAYDLADNSPEVYQYTAWMPEGSIPFINWINGIPNAKRMVDSVRKAYHPETDVLTQDEVDKLKAEGKKVPKDAMKKPKTYLSEVYQGPRVRLFGLQLEGPIHDVWPPKSHQLIVGSNTDPRAVRIPETIVKFASKAFRRPVTQAEVQHYIDYINNKIAYGTSHEEAIKLGLTAILCSPRFLYLDEGKSEESQYLDQFELATRLSYTFWCSMPSDGLFKLAAQGKLQDPGTLVWALDRFLDDARSSAFIEHFADSWLRLDKVGSMPPATRDFRSYYADRLEPAMLRETHMFFNHIVRQNEPITDFIDADYTFLNDNLAKHYGITGVEGEEFQRVHLSSEHYDQRSGLLGQASILTATANGIETSPVTRGVWILENILGTPPSPPPPDVPPIEPDIRGAVTIREQLAKHRSIASCNNCHANIDPWGFALERYDPIGAYRERYGKGKNTYAIETYSELPNGLGIEDHMDLKQELVRHKREFTKNLARKLLIYSTGRELTYRDEPELNQIVKEVAHNGYHMRDLLHAVVKSDIFRRR